MKHTNGPWTVNEHPYNDQPEYILTAERTSETYGQTEVATVLHDKVTNIVALAVVARAKQLGGMVTLEEAKANALLIAAAPELLTAVEEARNYLLSDICSDTPDPVRRVAVVQQLDEAVTKATRL